MFFYILALFVIGTILLIGIKYVIKITEQVESIDLVEFKTSLTTDVDVMVTKYGSWKKKTYTVPQGVKTVCFFTIDKYPNSCSSLPNLDPVMCDAWQSGTQNVMTIPFVIDSSINLIKMEVKDPKGYQCFGVTDKKITIKLTGIGNGVRISEP